MAYGNEVWYSKMGDMYNQFLLLSSFLVFRNMNISYCWIHKGNTVSEDEFNIVLKMFLFIVASTSWQTLFMRLENNTKLILEDKPYRTMFRLSPKSSKDFEFISQNFFNFILVRHPFHRLVSAYSDRIKGCKMKAEWYIKVQKMFNINRETDCLADSNIGKINLNKENKLSIEKKPVVIPTFR